MLYLFFFIYFSYFCRGCRCACRKHRSRRSCAEVHESGRPFLVTPGHQTGTLQKNWQHYEENDTESVEVRVCYDVDELSSLRPSFLHHTVHHHRVQGNCIFCQTILQSDEFIYCNVQCLILCFRYGICSYCGANGADGDGVKYTVVLFCMSTMNRVRILKVKVRVKNTNCSTRAKTESTSTPWKCCYCYILKERAENTNCSARAKTESTSTPWMY